MTATLVLLVCLPAASDVIQMKNGTLIKGSVESTTDTSVTVKLPSGASVTLPLNKIAPSSVYRLRLAQLDGKDAAGHLTLGDYCLKNGLLAQSRAMYRKAGRIDPTQVATVAMRLTAVDEQHAKALYELAENAYSNALHQQAMEHIKKILAHYPNTSFAPKARSLSQQVLTAMSKPKKLAHKASGQTPKKSATPKGPASKPGGPAPAKPMAPKPIDPSQLKGTLRKLYDAVKKLEALGDKHNALGLKADGKGNVSRAKKNFELAGKYYDEGNKLIRRVPKLTRDRATLALFRILFDQLRHKIVNSLMNAANTMAGERNWRRAAEYVDLALRLDPANRQALKLKQKIEENRIVRKASKVTNTKPIVHGK